LFEDAIGISLLANLAPAKSLSKKNSVAAAIALGDILLRLLIHAFCLPKN